MSGQASSGDRRLHRAVRRARRQTCSPLLYVGALTVAVAHEVVGWLVGSGTVSESWAIAAIVPVVLALLYGQLIALAYLRDPE